MSFEPLLFSDRLLITFAGLYLGSSTDILSLSLDAAVSMLSIMERTSIPLLSSYKIEWSWCTRESSLATLALTSRSQRQLKSKFEIADEVT